jgi:hypothetical protein
MRDMFAYMQTIGAATGVAPPPSLFATPPRPPAEFSTPVSMDKFYPCLTFTYFVSYMGSLLLFAESIGGLK